MLTKLLYWFMRSRRYRKGVVSYGGNRISVEIADTFAKQALGLMHREGIGSDEGMLFVFGRENQESIWIMDMKFGIDIVWMNSAGKVVGIEEGAVPCRSIFNCKTYAPSAKAKYVLEINSGKAKRLGIRIGETLLLRLGA
ncbi:putative ACR [uncultured archaeon]|nr:putative ACR [uncultured archaeon]